MEEFTRSPLSEPENWGIKLTPDERVEYYFEREKDRLLMFKRAQVDYLQARMWRYQAEVRRSDARYTQNANDMEAVHLENLRLRAENEKLRKKEKVKK